LCRQDDRGSSFSSRTVSRASRTASRSRSIFDFGYNFRLEDPTEKTFDEIRADSIQGYQEDLHKLRVQGGWNLLAVLILIIFGMGVMMGIENWNSADAFYWATVTITTVGYGDIIPTTRSGKIFTMFYVILGCSYVAKAMTDFVKLPLLTRLLKNEIKVINQFSGNLSKEKLESIFQNEFYQLIPDLKRAPNEMSKCEFTLMVLQLMNKVEEKDIFLVAKLFENLDRDRKGWCVLFAMFVIACFVLYSVCMV
jgi:hypothetical protein